MKWQVEAPLVGNHAVAYVGHWEIFFRSGNLWHLAGIAFEFVSCRCVTFQREGKKNLSEE